MATISQATSRVEIGTNIAYGVGRSPLMWAAEARDLDELSCGPDPARAGQRDGHDDGELARRERRVAGRADGGARHRAAQAVAARPGPRPARRPLLQGQSPADRRHAAAAPRAPADLHRGRQPAHGRVGGPRRRRARRPSDVHAQVRRRGRAPGARARAPRRPAATRPRSRSRASSSARSTTTSRPRAGGSPSPSASTRPRASTTSSSPCTAGPTRSSGSARRPARATPRP